MKRCTGVALRMLIVTLALFSGVAVRSQTTTGSISGTVKDPDGAVIPDIAVIAKNIGDRGRSKTRSPTRKGSYAFPTLPVGTYELDTFRPGFKPYKRTGLVIDINTKLQIDITLEVGDTVRTGDRHARTRSAGGDREHADGRRRYRPGDDRSRR